MHVRIASDHPPWALRQDAPAESSAAHERPPLLKGARARARNTMGEEATVPFSVLKTSETTRDRVHG